MSVLISVFVLCCLLLVTTNSERADAGELSSGKIRIALVGDSTVTDTAGWGQTFPDHFNGMVEVLNFAKGGRSSRSWYTEDLLPQALHAKPDYVFIQFGHNDQPGKGAKRETDPATTYREFLRLYVTRFRETGAIPIVVSSVARRRFDESGRIQSTLTPWAAAACAVAAEMDTPFVDLHAASIAYYERIGREASMAMNPKVNDITHFTAEGSEAISSLVVNGLDAISDLSTPKANKATDPLRAMLDQLADRAPRQLRKSAQVRLQIPVTAPEGRH